MPDDVLDHVQQPLASGFDPWQVTVYDESKLRAEAQRKVAKERFQRELEEHGVTVTCETCGHQWKMHPAQASRVYACSQRCRDKAFRKRKKDGSTRPLMPMPHKPWEKRRRQREQTD